MGRGAVGTSSTSRSPMGRDPVGFLLSLAVRVGCVGDVARPSWRRARAEATSGVGLGVASHGTLAKTGTCGVLRPVGQRVKTTVLGKVPWDAVPSVPRVPAGVPWNAIRLASRGRSPAWSARSRVGLGGAAPGDVRRLSSEAAPLRRKRAAHIPNEDASKASTASGSPSISTWATSVRP